MRWYRCVAAGLLLSLLAGCATPGAEVPQVTATPQPPSAAVSVPTMKLPPSDPVEELLSAMSTEERVGQLLVAGVEGFTLGEDARAAVEDFHLGGIILFGRNVESAAQLTTLLNDLKALNGEGVPLFLSVDEEGGQVSRMPGEVMSLPNPYDYMVSGGDPYRLGEALALRCAAFGFNLDYAPVLDTWSNPENTVIGKRAFSTTWAGVRDAGPACAQGLADGGLVPVIKHFPGHGDTLEDSHITLPLVKKGLSQLMEEELLPFRAAIEGGVPAVMVGHILVEALDAQYPASLSPRVVDGLLRSTLGFDGVVVTDDLTMGAVANSYPMGEAAVLAVEAGCDLLLVCHGAENLSAARTALLEAVKSGRISAARLEESVKRILQVKEEYGLSNQALPLPDAQALNASVEALLNWGAPGENSHSLLCTGAQQGTNLKLASSK